MNGYSCSTTSGGRAAVLCLALLALMPVGLRAQDSGLISGQAAEAADIISLQSTTPEADIISGQTETSFFLPALVSGQTVTSPEFPGSHEQPGLIAKGQTLTINQCVDIALRRNPNIVAATNTVDVFQNRVGQSRAFYYPQVSAQAGYTRTDLGTAPTGTFARTSVRNDGYSGSVILSQSLLDLGKWSSVDVAKFNVASSRADLSKTENDTVLSVKQFYYQVLQAKRNRDVFADVIRQSQLHLDQARGFYDVGTKAKIDVIKAEVDLSNAKLNLINAENALKIAWVNLNNAMGVPDAPEYAIEDNLSFQAYQITLEEATAKAFENRPDLKSSIAKRQAAESGIGVARSGYYPTLTGTASYTKQGLNESPNELNSSWSAGVLLTMPLFNGFSTRHLVAEAKSNMYMLKASEESVRQQVLLEVRQAYLNLQATEASISTTELAAQQAKENLDLANGRYAAGVGSPVEVSDAFATYVAAQANHTSALATYKIARANIERAMGLR